MKYCMVVVVWIVYTSQSLYAQEITSKVHIIGPLISLQEEGLKKMGDITIEGIDAKRNYSKVISIATQRTMEKGGNILKVRQI